MNDRDKIVGTGVLVTGGGIAVERAVLWYRGRIRSLGTLPLGGRADMPNASAAVHINGRGDIAGTSWVESNDPAESATLWRNDGKRRLGGSRTTVPVAVNDRGQVVGYLSSGTRASPEDRQAVLWRGRRVVRLGSLPGRPYSEAVDLDERGRVLVNAYDAKEEYLPFDLHPVRERAFVWRAGRRIDLGTLGGRRTWAVAMNQRAEVVGWSTTARGRVHAFVWRRGRMTDLGALAGDWASKAVAINDRGQVVGVSRRRGRTRAFIWQRGRMGSLGTLGGGGTVASALNDRGQVVGSSATARGVRHAFVWENGRMADLGSLGRRSSHAVAINARGTIIGSSGDRPVVWTKGSAR